MLCRIRSRWRVEKLRPDGSVEWSRDVSKPEGNCMLNEGISLLEDLLIAAGGTAYNNANAYIGVGSDATTPDKTQTGLVTALAYAAMDVGFPTRVGTVLTFRSTFIAGVGTGTWKELSLANSNSDLGTNLCREIWDAADWEAKAAGEVFRATCTVEIL